MILRPTKRVRASAATALATLALLVPAAPLAFAAASGLRLSFSGAIRGTLVSGEVVCNSHVAAAKHKFFFDISGRAAAKTVVLSGDVAGYSSPRI
ncbi:MAG TPA: hypothetical protein VFN61_05140 [Acidimicrobiales bacterium]|nr:hypothetical protein [Acidimicrobiales bacterium]